MSTCYSARLLYSGPNDFDARILSRTSLGQRRESLSIWDPTKILLPLLITQVTTCNTSRLPLKFIEPQVPETSGLIVAAGDDPVVVGANRHGFNNILMAEQHPPRLSGIRCI